jgi:hypothetical protein
MVTAVKMTAPVLGDTLPVLGPAYPVYTDVDPTYIDNIKNVGLRKNPLHILCWWARKGRCM